MTIHYQACFPTHLSKNISNSGSNPVYEIRYFMEGTRRLNCDRDEARWIDLNVETEKIKLLPECSIMFSERVN